MNSTSPGDTPARAGVSETAGSKPVPERALPQAAAWSNDELIPFGKYILLNKLSSGATAAVYRARLRAEPGFEHIVTIKRILPQMAGDAEFVETFVEEAKLCARLTHANICPIYELGKVGESLYMALQWVAGKDLGAVIRRFAASGQPMPPIAAAWIASRLCDALDYAHGLKDAGGKPLFVHQDLSPANIVISYEGEVKLLDFGIARATGRAQQTNVDALKQKLGYMSPELVHGEVPDPRSDVFGIGVCLFEMVTGQRLFAGADDIATLKLVSAASIKAPSSVCDGIPPALEAIILRALAREPDGRWSSAGEMASALAEYVSGADASFGPRNLAELMLRLFEHDMLAERMRLHELVSASHDPQLIEQRRRFFASPLGAAAVAKAEAARRAKTSAPPGPLRPEPASGHTSTGASASAVTPSPNAGQASAAAAGGSPAASAPAQRAAGAAAEDDDAVTRYHAPLEKPASSRSAALLTADEEDDDEPTSFLGDVARVARAVRAGASQAAPSRAGALPPTAVTRAPAEPTTPTEPTAPTEPTVPTAPVPALTPSAAIRAMGEPTIPTGPSPDSPPSATTRAMGEPTGPSSSDSPPSATTRAMGEPTGPSSPALPPSATTRAMGEPTGPSSPALPPSTATRAMREPTGPSPALPPSAATRVPGEPTVPTGALPDLPPSATTRAPSEPTAPRPDLPSAAARPPSEPTAPTAPVPALPPSAATRAPGETVPTGAPDLPPSAVARAPGAPIIPTGALPALPPSAAARAPGEPTVPTGALPDLPPSAATRAPGEPTVPTGALPDLPPSAAARAPGEPTAPTSPLAARSRPTPALDTSAGSTLLGLTPQAGLEDAALREAHPDDSALAVIAKARDVAQFEEQATQIFFSREHGFGLPELPAEEELSPNVPAPLHMATPSASVRSKSPKSRPPTPPPGRGPRQAAQSTPATPTEARPNPVSTGSSARATRRDHVAASQATQNLKPQAGSVPAPSTQPGSAVSQGISRSDVSAALPMESLAALQRSGARGTRGKVAWVVAAVLAAMATVAFTHQPVGIALGLRKPPYGVLEVRTAPDVSAAIRIDGTYRGRTPMRLEDIPAGSRVLELEAEGYERVSRLVTIEGGAVVTENVQLNQQNAAASAR